MKNIVQYINLLITIMNSNLDISVLNHYSCQKKTEEIFDNLQDYIELVNKLQYHTQYNSSYYLWVNHLSQQQCRFGYPKKIVKDTCLCDNNNGYFKLIIARNDSYINSYDWLQF